jgi:hypothetical protein
MLSKYSFWSFLFFMILVFQSVDSLCQDSLVLPVVTINSAFTVKMLDQNQDLRKVSLLINERKAGTLKDRGLTIGASLISIVDYQRSSEDSKFAYLMRHPTPSNQIGKEVSEAVVHSFQVMLTGTVNRWMAAHTELLYNPEQSFGSGTITSLGRNQLQLRKAFVLLGDLNRFPVFAAVGKMDAPFGQTGSVNPFSNTTMWHAFGGLGYGAMIGVESEGLNLRFMAIQGGAQFRALHTPVGDSTNVPSSLNNFSVDLNYTFNIDEGVTLTAGGSYLHGSAYCQDFPITHFAECDDVNPAYTYYVRLNVKDRLILKGGFAETFDVWPGTHNPTPPLDQFEASKVSSLDAGLQVRFNTTRRVVYVLSGEFSNFRAGPDGAPWERQNQILIGVSALFDHSSSIFLELFRTDGYAPLNFISGSDPFSPFPPGQTHSFLDASSHGIVLGVRANI